MTTFEGSWTINKAVLASSLGKTSVEDFLNSVSPLSSSNPVADISITTDSMGKKCPPYLKLVPYGPNIGEMDRIVENADIFTFLLPHRGQSTLPRFPDVAVLKQRGWHAEIGYLNDDGKACQAAPFFDESTLKHDRLSDDISEYSFQHIFRLRIDGVDEERINKLKAQVKYWKIIFNRFTFASSNMNTDPIDFSSYEELLPLANALINQETTHIPPITCVQWSYQVLCLALNFPLNQKTLEPLDLWKKFAMSWPALVGKTDSGLEGLKLIPLPPHSPARIIQMYLDIYAPSLSLKTLPLNKVFNSLTIPLQYQRAAENYVNDRIRTGEIDTPFTVDGKTFRYILPISFYCACLNSSLMHPNARFEYVATAAPKDVLIKR